MGFRPNFSKQDVKRAIEVKRIAFRQAVLNRFELVGWEFVRMARLKTAAQGGFNDVTGNLRSSIGFAIIDHGNVKLENYEGKGSEGKQKAKGYVRELKTKFEDGFALVVVAGMGYAAAVESRGKDVITGTSLEAEIVLKAAIARLKSKVS